MCPASKAEEEEADRRRLGGRHLGARNGPVRLAPANLCEKEILVIFSGFWIQLKNRTAEREDDEQTEGTAGRRAVSELAVSVAAALVGVELWMLEIGD